MFYAIKLWEGSNGPIYTRAAFLWNVQMWLFTYAFCILLLSIARPSTTKPSTIFADPRIAGVPRLIQFAEFLWPLNSGQLEFRLSVCDDSSVLEHAFLALEPYD